MTVVISGRVYAADGDRAASIVADEGAEREGARDEGALLLLRLPLLVPRRSRSDTLTPPTSQAQRRRFDKTVANLANARTKVATLREKINTTSVPKLLEVCVCERTLTRCAAWLMLRRLHMRFTGRTRARRAGRGLRPVGQQAAEDVPGVVDLGREHFRSRHAQHSRVCRHSWSRWLDWGRLTRCS